MTNGSPRPGLATRIADYERRIQAILFAVLVVVASWWEAFDGPRWAKQAPAAAHAAFLVIVATAAIGLAWRGWRSGVRFDDHGVTIRRILRTRRFGWPEVSHFADGQSSVHGTPVWAPQIVLRDGRAFTLGEWAWDGKKAPDCQILAAVAGRYGIPAEFDFVPRPSNERRLN